MKHPKRLKTNFLAEVTGEVRFASAIPADAVVGILYAAIKNEYGELVSNPIAQLPPPIRDSDPAMRYLPTHRLSSRGFIVQCGPRSISLSAIPYNSFDEMSIRLRDLLNKVESAGIFASVERIGLRYINVFPDRNIFADLNLKMQVRNKSITDRNLWARWEDQRGRALVVTNLSNSASAQQTVSAPHTSMADIDVIVAAPQSDNSVNTTSLMEDFRLANETANDVFFDLMKTDFVNSLGPEY